MRSRPRKCSGEYLIFTTDGEEVRGRVNANGDIVAPGRGVIPRDQIVDTMSADERSEANSQVTKFRDDRLLPAQNQRLAVNESIRIADRTIQRVKNNPLILTTAGGPVASLLNSINVEMSAVAEMASRYGGDPSVEGSRVDPAEFNRAIGQMLSENSSDYNAHVADITRLAYAVALSQNDRVTDADFKNAMDQIARGKEVGTFVEVMTNNINDSVKRLNDTIKLGRKSNEVDRFVKDYGNFFNLERELQTFEERTEGTDVGAAWQRLQRARNEALGNGDPTTDSSGRVPDGGSGQSAGGDGTRANPLRVSSPDEVQSLKPGQYYKTPDGRVFMIPGDPEEEQ